MNAIPPAAGDLPLGVRNNNPGNIRFNSTIHWRQQKADPNEGMCVFPTPTWGIRPIFILFHNYMEIDSLRTLAQMLTRWAPPVENDTRAYIADVCERCRVDPNKPFDYWGKCKLLVPAVIAHECDNYTYDQSIIQTAFVLSLER